LFPATIDPDAYKKVTANIQNNQKRSVVMAKIGGNVNINGLSPIKTAAVLRIAMTNFILE